MTDCFRMRSDVGVKVFSRLHFVIAIGLCCLVSSASAQSTPKISDSRAVTPANFDRSCVPCRDFYGHVNGGWIRRSNLVRLGWTGDPLGTFAEIMNESSPFIRNAILAAAAHPSVAQRTSNPGTESGIVGDTTLNTATLMVGTLYNRCMSHSQTSEDLTHVLKPWLARIDTMRRAEDILATAGAMDRDGIRVMLHFTSDFRQSVASRIGVLRRDGLGLPEFSFYARTDAKAVSARRTYVQHVTNILQLLGEPAAAAEARKIMELEIRLGKFRLTDSAVREANASYNAMMREELLAFTPRIDWSVYFNTLGVNPPSIVNVETPPFVAALDTVLTSFPLSTWQAYFKLRLVDRMYPTLGERFVRQYENYSNQLNGIPPTQSRISQNEANRSHQCLQTVVELLPGAVGRLYATTKFSPTLEKRARDMFEHLKRAMEQRLKNVQWMSDSTKPKALAKLSTMTMRVIYPKDFRIDYTGLVLSSSSYVENVAAIRRFNRARELRNVGRSPDTSLWVGSPMQAGAYYAGRGVDSGKVIFNHIMVDAGLLAAPVFDTAADDASNYGALGAIIGHEITHAFDGNGRLQDKEGHPRDWWTPKESEEFTRRSRRLSDQYSKYILIDTFHVDGNLTVNENIADLGGVLVAYDAWEDAMAGKRRTPLEGLTPEQRFFVSFANVWRWNVRPDILRLFIWKDNHAIPRWRVNGVLPNVPGFAKAFGCKPGDTLAPPADQRIAIW